MKQQKDSYHTSRVLSQPPSNGSGRMINGGFAMITGKTNLIPHLSTLANQEDLKFLTFTKHLKCLSTCTYSRL